MTAESEVLGCTQVTTPVDVGSVTVTLPVPAGLVALAPTLFNDAPPFFPNGENFYNDYTDYDYGEGRLPEMPPQQCVRPRFLVPLPATPPGFRGDYDYGFGDYDYSGGDYSGGNYSGDFNGDYAGGGDDAESGGDYAGGAGDYSGSSDGIADYGPDSSAGDGADDPASDGAAADAVSVPTGDDESASEEDAAFVEEEDTASSSMAAATLSTGSPPTAEVAVTGTGSASASANGVAAFVEQARRRRLLDAGAGSDAGDGGDYSGGADTAGEDYEGSDGAGGDYSDGGDYSGADYSRDYNQDYSGDYNYSQGPASGYGTGASGIVDLATGVVYNADYQSLDYNRDYDYFDYSDYTARPDLPDDIPLLEWAPACPAVETTPHSVIFRTPDLSAGAHEFTILVRATSPGAPPPPLCATAETRCATCMEALGFRCDCLVEAARHEHERACRHLCAAASDGHRGTAARALWSLSRRCLHRLF